MSVNGAHISYLLPSAHESKIHQKIAAKINNYDHYATLGGFSLRNRRYEAVGQNTSHEIIGNITQTRVVNDPLGQFTVLAGSEDLSCFA